MAPGAKQQTSLPSQVWFVGRTNTRARPVGSSRLRSTSLAGILDTLSPAIGFSSSMRLRQSRPPTNCTWVSLRYRKGSEDYTPVCGVCLFAPTFPTRGGECPHRLGDVMFKSKIFARQIAIMRRPGLEQIADLLAKCSNPAHRDTRTLCE
jgi:hypothetical protein